MILRPETTRTLHFDVNEDSSINDANIDSTEMHAQNENQKPHKTWNNVCNENHITNRNPQQPFKENGITFIQLVA